jgi:environmental stress-induced protein Ves
VRIVRSSQVLPEPWANGGGRTRTLLAWPDAGAWKLRISVADVDRAGPFSVFPGIDRWFAVIEGDGVRLQTAGRPPVLLGTDAPEMHAFPGDTTTDCDLPGEPTRDLNVMVRRHYASATVRSLRSGALRSTARVLGCFCDDATLRVDGSAQVELPRHALAWIENPARRALAWEAAEPVPRGWWVEANLVPGDALHAD